MIMIAVLSLDRTHHHHDHRPLFFFRQSQFLLSYVPRHGHNLEQHFRIVLTHSVEDLGIKQSFEPQLRGDAFLGPDQEVDLGD